MKRKNKGRKIYKTKEKNYYGKSPLGKALSAALTVLLIGGIGFIGYSVAEPIINYTQHKGDKPAEETTSAEPAGEETTEDTSAGTVEPKAPEKYNAAGLVPTDMATAETLKTALSAVPRSADIEFVEVPLKVRGGKIYYATTNQEAYSCGAVSSKLSLATITALIEESGFKPAAEISTFYDNQLPTYLPEAGYVTVDDGSQWVDNDPAHGGVPWTAPTSQEALTYISSIIDEVTDAGFERIVCTDIMYPYFRESDLALLDEQLGRTDRFLALTSAANLFYERSVSGGASMYVGVSAADMLRGNCDVLQPQLLSANTVVLTIDTDELKKGVSDGKMLYEFEGTPADITEKCLGFLSDRLTDLNVTVRISGSGATAEELMAAKEKAAARGYTSFVIG
ncbi:MAG: putative glycoside hydrolase [Ruminococcus sp.]|nr:putative glycoside hydrolase [Ruminococcus sp.]